VIGVLEIGVLEIGVLVIGVLVIGVLGSGRLGLFLWWKQVAYIYLDSSSRVFFHFFQFLTHASKQSLLAGLLLVGLQSGLKCPGL
jgi:hypothetical protein